MDNDSSLSIDELLRESAWVTRLARSLVRDTQAADDLVQETWVSALSRPPRERTSPRGWLATVLRNALRQQRRRETTRARHEASSAAPTDGPSPAALAERVELSRRVARFALDLDEPFRSTVLRRHFEGLTSAEIARRDGVPEGTVRWRLKEGLDRLRGRLDRDFGGDRRAWCAALVPLARQEMATSAGLTALTAGGLLMKMTYVAAAVLVVGAAVVFAPWGSGDRPDEESPVGVAVVKPAQVPGAEREVAVVAPPVAVADSAAEPEAAPEPVPSTLAMVVARVVDTSGQPLAGAIVELTDIPGYRTATGADGTARLRGQVPEEMLPWIGNAASFRASRAGYTTEVVMAKLVLGEEVPLGDIVLAPAATVIGRVEDEAGRPIEGATVRSQLVVDGRPVLTEELNSEAEATTDRSGRFELPGVPTGTVCVGARSETHDLAYSEVLALGPGDLREGVVVTLTPRAPRLAKIEGVVVDPDGRPVADAMVRHAAQQGMVKTSGSTRSANDGTFSIMPNLPTTYRLHALSPDGTHRPSEPLDVAAGQRVTLRLRPSLTFEVVARGRNGARLEEAEALTALDGSNRWTYKASDGGRLSLQLPDASFRLRVSAPFHDEVELGPFDPSVIAAEGSVEVDLPPLPPLAGRVTLDGEPVEGADVRVHEVTHAWAQADGFMVGVQPSRAAQGETAEDGTFALMLRDAGEFVVRVMADGAAPAEVGPFRFDPAVNVAPFDVRLTAGGVLEGRVLPPPGRSPAGTTVGISRGDGYARTVRVGLDGAFRFARLLPGRYHVVRHDRDLSGDGPESFGTGGDRTEEIPWSCEVFEGRTTRFDLDLSMCVIRGVIAPLEALVDGLRVSLVDPRTDRVIGATAAPGSDGRFVLIAPTAAVYRVRVADSTGSERLVESLEVTFGETRWRGEL